MQFKSTASSLSPRTDLSMEMLSSSRMHQMSKSSPQTPKEPSTAKDTLNVSLALDKMLVSSASSRAQISPSTT